MSEAALKPGDVPLSREELRRIAGWMPIKTVDDLPEQTGVAYVFEYNDGKPWVWEFIVGAGGALVFRSPGTTVWKDPNDLVNECRWWRPAWSVPVTD